MDQIAAMRSFVRTVETGSFSAVAREVGTFSVFTLIEGAIFTLCDGPQAVA